MVLITVLTTTVAANNASAEDCVLLHLLAREEQKEYKEGREEATKCHEYADARGHV